MTLLCACFSPSFLSLHRSVACANTRAHHDHSQRIYLPYLRMDVFFVLIKRFGLYTGVAIGYGLVCIILFTVILRTDWKYFAEEAQARSELSLVSDVPRSREEERLLTESTTEN